MPTMPLLNEGQTHRVIRNGAAALHCRARGDGPAVVMLASWSLPAESWAPQMETFCAAGMRCIAYDRRGHGASPDPGGPYDFDTLADDLAAVIEAYDVTGATLLTFSGASGEAVRYLSRHGGGRIARLAMIAPTTPLLERRADNPDGIDPAVITAFIETELRLDWQGWLRRNGRPFAGPDVAQATIDWIIGLAQQASPHALAAFQRALARTDFRAELPRLDLPVLIVQGDQDLSAPLELTGRKSAALIPGARLVVYEGAPHGVIVSHTARLDADLLAFMREG